MRAGAAAAALCAVLLSSCAGTPAPIDEGAAPGGTTSIVVGRSQVVLNGHLMRAGDSGGGFVKAQVINHVSPLADGEEINLNRFKPGQWAARAFLSEDGYFAINLPPGRYYFVEYGFPGMTDWPPGVRSYQSLSWSTLGQPFLTTFVVQPGVATYVGTMQHVINGSSSKGGTWRFQVLDESNSARDWLATKYPGWAPSMRTALMQSHPMY